MSRPLSRLCFNVGSFFKDLRAFKVMFYLLPDIRTVVILFSSLFIISEKFENKKVN